MPVEDTQEQEAGTQGTSSGDAGETAEAKKKLNLQVEIKQPGACQRHITVTISREDIDRYLSEAIDELAPKAQVPGFRAGKAPRGLVEKRFREQVVEQVKGSLLMDSMTQITEDHNFAAISEPKFDVDVIKVPEEGPMVFEFDLEVRPEFDLPSWEGLQLERPVHEYTDEEIDRHLQIVLGRYGQLEPKDGPVEPNDLVDLHLVVTSGDKPLQELDLERVSVKSKLSFRDAQIDGFDQILAGAQAGDRREAKAVISKEAEREEMRGQEVSIGISVQRVQRMELPKMTNAFLDRIGGFEDEDELRDAVRKELERQLSYEQQRRLRDQITNQLLRGANWDLPPDLLKGQFRRELERSVMELQRNGFSDEVIRTHQNEIRQNSLNATAKALKEHFILERIAEDQKIDAETADFDAEIRLIAAQRGQNARQVRAAYEKRGQIDALRNQIVERKVIELIMSKAQFSDVPLDLKPQDSFAVDQAICGAEEKAIPEAQHAGEPEGFRQPALHG